MNPTSVAFAAYAAADAAALASGSIEILDSGGNVLRTFALPAGSAGTVAGVALTISGLPIVGVGSAVGAASEARYVTSADQTYHDAMSVGLPGSGAEIEIDNQAGTLEITADTEVSLVSATINHA